MLNSVSGKIDLYKEEVKKYLTTNENGNITFQNLQNTSKAVLRGRFKKQEKSQINHLALHQKQLEKEK